MRTNLTTSIVILKQSLKCHYQRTSDNFYECLGQLGSEPLVESASNENLEELFNRTECKIRTKVKTVMKRKLEEKLENIQIDETDLKALKEALAEDEEELVEYYKGLKFEIVEEKHEEGSISPYGPPEGCSGFYWGGEDGSEIIFYD
jgi:hypothetical protein